MTETLKYGSNLYLPDKPYYKMTMEELVNHTKICKSLDKTSYKKILRMEKWDASTLEKKKRKFFNKQTQKKTRKANLLKKTRKKRLMKKNKTRIKKEMNLKQKTNHRKTKKSEII